MNRHSMGRRLLSLIVCLLLVFGATVPGLAVEFDQDTENNMYVQYFGRVGDGDMVRLHGNHVRGYQSGLSPGDMNMLYFSSLFTLSEIWVLNPDGDADSLVPDDWTVYSEFEKPFVLDESEGDGIVLGPSRIVRFVYDCEGEDGEASAAATRVVRESFDDVSALSGSETPLADAVTCDPVEVRLNGYVSVSGREMTQDDSFLFSLESIPAGSDVVPSNGPAVQSVPFKTLDENEDTYESDADFNTYQVFDFGTLTLSPSTTCYNFSMKQVTGKSELGDAYDRDLDYDGTEYVISIQVDDTGLGYASPLIDISRVEGSDNVSSTYREQEGSIMDVPFDFVNVYNPKPQPTSVTFTAGVDMEGRSFNNDSVSFTVTPWKTSVEGVNIPDFVDKTFTAQSGSSVKFTFTSGQYEAAGDYYYVISQNAGGDSLISYDEARYVLRVHVVEPETAGGVLVPSLNIKKLGAGDEIVEPGDGDTANIEFTNVYTPNALTDSIRVRKVLSGRDWKASDSFEVTMSGDATATKAITGPDEVEIPVMFASAGTYEYTLAETTGNIPGISYDDSTWTVRYEVGQNADGSLAVSSKTVTRNAGTSRMSMLAVGMDAGASALSDDDTVMFTNTYRPSPATVSFGGKVRITGREFAFGDSFSFELTGDGRMPTSTSAMVTPGSGSEDTFTFGNASFDSVGTYNYKISASPAAGLKLSATDCDITVTVTDDGSGQLKASVDKQPEDCVFTYAYEMQPIDVDIKGSVGVSGRTFSPSDTFRVTLTPAAGMGDPVSLDLNDLSGSNMNVVFTGTYPGAGTYRYTMTCTTTAQDLTCEKTSYDVVLVVTNENGILKYRFEGDSEFKFNYVYEEPEMEDAILRIGGKVTIKGREFDEGNNVDDWYAVAIEPINGTSADYVPSPDILDVDPAGGNEFAFEFNPITYDAEGTYEYKVVQTNSDLNVLPIGSEEYTVRVVVTKEGGKLRATTTYIKDGVEVPEFVFAYRTPAEFSLEAGAYMTGRAWNQDDGFEIRVRPHNDVFTLYEQGLVEFPNEVRIGIGNDGQPLDSNGSGYMSRMQPIKFHQAGDYLFEVTQTDEGKMPGVMYDGTVWILTVHVTDVDNNFNVTWDAQSTDGKTENRLITFHNSWSGDDNLELGGKVKLERPFDPDDRFFVRAEPITEGAPEFFHPYVCVWADNGTESNFDLGRIGFTSEGVYKYRIWQEIPDESGTLYDPELDYDTGEYVLTVTCTVENGKLHATPVLTRDGKTVESVEFFNKNKGSEPPEDPNVVKTPVTLPVSVTKVLTGRPWLDTDAFTFALEPKDSAQAVIDEGFITMPESTDLTVTDAGNHAASFGTIGFRKAGTYEFVIKETTGSMSGVSHKTGEKVLTVTAVKNGDTLDLTLSLDGEDVTSVNPVFTSEYRTSGTIDVDIKGRVEMNGRDFNELDDLSVTCVSGDVSDTMSLRNARGNSAEFTFTATFDGPGTYRWTLSQTGGGDPNTTYDTASREVVIVVTDNYDGTLSASIQSGENPVFTNNYVEPDTLRTAVRIDASVEINGREWLDGDVFNIILTPGNDVTNNAMNAGTVLVSGSGTLGLTRDNKSASFPNIVFTEPGTYLFDVHQERGSIGGIVYDDEAYAVKVTVRESNGQLTASCENNVMAHALVDSGVTGTFSCGFTNRYVVRPVQASLTGSIEIEGREFENDTFSVQATGDGYDETESVTCESGVSKSFDFPSITFDRPGQYTYNIRLIFNGDNLSCDMPTMQVRFDVTDNLDGTMSVVRTPLDSDRLAFKLKYVELLENQTRASVSVAKSLKGRDWLSSDRFEFILSAGDSITERAVMDGLIIMPSATKVIATENGRNPAFGDIVFKNTGRYTFTVSEIAGSQGGVAYDSKEYELVMDVTEAGDGYHVEVTGSSRSPKSNALSGLLMPLSLHDTGVTGKYTCSFENAYAPATASMPLSGSVQLDNNFEDGQEFLVSVVPKEENMPMPGQSEFRLVKNGSDRIDADLGVINFDRPGEYVYNISISGTGVELEGSTAFTLTVTVSDNGDGTLAVTKHITDGKGAEVDDIAFDVSKKGTGDVPSSPSPTPTPTPTPSSKPTEEPSSTPSEEPSSKPTEEPSSSPSEEPSTPSEKPSSTPSEEPGSSSEEPSSQPTEEPGMSSDEPSSEPTDDPSSDPGTSSDKPDDSSSEDPGTSSGDPSSSPDNSGSSSDNPGNNSGSGSSGDTSPSGSDSPDSSDVEPGPGPSDSSGDDTTSGSKKGEKITPETGIDANSPWIVVAIVSCTAVALVIIAFVVFNKRKDEDEHKDDPFV